MRCHFPACLQMNSYVCACCSFPGRSFAADHSSSSVNGDASVLNTSHTSSPNGYICRDCSFHSQKMDSSVIRSSSSSSSHAAEASSEGLSYSSSPFTNVYSRDRSQRSKTGEELSTQTEMSHWKSHMLLSTSVLMNAGAVSML